MEWKVRSDRRIEVSLTLTPGLDKDQAEYLVACVLCDHGVPINPMVQELQYGDLTYVQVGSMRFYSWHGEDRRI